MKKEKKVGIITQARLGSQRLTGKILLTANGIPLLKYHIDRLRESGYPVFLATTDQDSDQQLVDFAIKEGLEYHRGSETNVLSRFYECAEKNNLDVIVRVTSDCPLIDGKFIAKGVQEYLRQENPRLYITNGIITTYPRGMDFEIFSFNMLKQAFEEADEPDEFEHVTPFIHRNRPGNYNFMYLQREVNKSNYRLTVDTSEDFTLIKTLIEQYNAHLLDVNELISLLDEHPELPAINAGIEQKNFRFVINN